MRWICCTAALIAAVGIQAQVFDGKLFERLEYRAIGPAIMGGRIADVEGVAGRPDAVYVGTASSGLFKTTNGGVTWTAQFEREGTISIGDLALDPRNPEVVWIGTGESNLRNSVSFGDGVYRSGDGGKTWKHMGLKDTRHISRVLVDPLNSGHVWVGAFGHAYGPNEERGVFVTTDGGSSWQKTLYIDSGHGVSDMDIHPANPNLVYAGMWRFERKPWTHISGSEQGGLFRSVDGGKTWKKVTQGLPKLMGRIGVKVAPSKPDVVYVIAESNEGTLFRSDNGGESFREVSRNKEIVSRGFYYADMRVDPTDENRLYFLATSMFVSIDGGKTVRTISGKTHSDYHALWIDPANPQVLWQGQDGGVAVSRDRGETWIYVNNLPLAQFYQIHADNQSPFYMVSGGLQDNGTWRGPSRTREPAGILNDDWRMISFGDGFHVVSHPDNPDLFLTESQSGQIRLMDMKTREQQGVSPQPRDSSGGPVNLLKYRFNWNTPIVKSPNEKNTVYFGGNVLFQSRNFGRSWEAISPDLTTNNPEKMKSAGGPAWFDNSSAEYHGTIISIAEAPGKPGVIWAGTDDGNLQATTDNGKTWTNVIGNVADLPANSPVSHVEVSGTSAQVVYAAFDRHMLDDYRPLIYRTADGGKSWRKISGGLPETAYVHVVKEDPKNSSLVYAGTELGLYVTPDGGGRWFFLGMKNKPKVAVHDILIHPRENDLILGTHGRSILIFDDITPLQQMKAEVAASDAHLFDVRAAVRHTTRFTRYGLGNFPFAGANPPYGALITYYLKAKPEEKTEVKLEILDGAGKVVRAFEKPPREAGLNRLAWDLRYEPAKARRPPTEAEIEFGFGPRGPQAAPGVYKARLSVGGKTYEQPVEVRLDPSLVAAKADMEGQLEVALKLRDLQNESVDLLRTFDSLKEQLEQAEKTAKARMPEAAKELEKLLPAWRKELSAASAKLGRDPEAPRLATGPELAEKIQSLLAQVDGVNAAPTAAQRAWFEELLKDARQKLGEALDFVKKKSQEWSGALGRLGLPGVV
jgi:photosystem II stability/assembly factor-like uncharacterized protein